MQLMSSFRREGIQIGTHQGKETLVILQMRKRFGAVSPDLTERLDSLSSEELDQLGVDFLDFTSANDLDDWLTRHRPNSDDATPAA